MSDAQDQPAPRNRRRTLRIALLILAFLLAALAAFVFVPAGGRSDSMQFLFQKVFTNEVDVAYAEFVVTNTGKRRVYLVHLNRHTQSGGESSISEVPFDRILHLFPQGSRKVNLRLPEAPAKWRLEWVWMDEPNRLQQWRYNMRSMADEILPGSASNTEKMLWSFSHTNHSQEFSR